MALDNISGYEWENEDLTCEKRLFELGCGNGSIANHLVVNK